MRGAYHSYRVKQAVLHESVLDTVLITLVSPSETLAHRTPCPVYVCTTAAEQQVVVELVFAYCRTSASEKTRTSAFDRQDRSSIIRRQKDVSSKSVRVWLPANLVVLAHFATAVSALDPTPML